MEFNWLIGLIPIIAALVGWGTNWLALKMTFYPLEYKGFGPFGWQGVIPSRAHKLAHDVMELITEKLMDIEVLLASLEPEKIAKEMEPKMEMLARKTIDEAMNRQMPMIWSVISKDKKEEVYRNARAKFPGLVKGLFEKIKNNIHTFFRPEELITEALTKDKDLLNRVFLKCGAKELKFIEHSGLYFGFLFGCIQMFFWSSLNEWWIMPLGGLFVGFATNWLALKLIFRPLNPYKIGPFVLQGIFIKRQKEVSEEYAEIFSMEVLTPENIFDHILKNEGAEKLIDLSQDHLKDGFDEIAGTTDRIVIKLVAGSEKYFSVRNSVVDAFIEVLPSSVREQIADIRLQENIRMNLSENMKALTPREFEGALHPIFQEEEWLLIMIGAGLGAGAGFLQLIFLL